MNWLRKEKRLAIYVRDGFSCCYCGECVEDQGGLRLTLDHLHVRSEGGRNKPDNLITACHHCNTNRSTMTVAQFARKVAADLNHGLKASQILRHIAECIARPIDVAAAKRLIARRGGFFAAVYARKAARAA